MQLTLETFVKRTVRHASANAVPTNRHVQVHPNLVGKFLNLDDVGPNWEMRLIIECDLKSGKDDTTLVEIIIMMVLASDYCSVEWGEFWWCDVFSSSCKSTVR